MGAGVKKAGKAKTSTEKSLAPKKSGTKKSETPTKSLDAAVAEFVKSASNDVAQLSRLSDDDCVAHVRRWVSTGTLELDRALTPPGSKVGGIPCGRVVEIYGDAHTGKSTLADTFLASFQRAGGVGILVETDSGRDARYTGLLGVDLEKLMYFEFKEGQKHLEAAAAKILESIIFWKTSMPDVPVLIVLDALGSTATEVELQSGKKDQPGMAARIVRSACRKWASYLTGSNITLIILNHEYAKISGMGGKDTYGGKGLHLLASLRLKLHFTTNGTLRDTSGVEIGKVIGYRIEKWKLGNVGGKGELTIISSEGVDNTATIYHTLADRGHIEVKGAWAAVNLGGEVIKFQGPRGFKAKCADQVFYQHMEKAYWEVFRNDATV